MGKRGRENSLQADIIMLGEKENEKRVHADIMKKQCFYLNAEF